MSHPVNPPYYVPLVEIVPAPWTRKDVCEKTRAIMLEIGQEPVSLSREIDGFVLNRIQLVPFFYINTVIETMDDPFGKSPKTLNGCYRLFTE